MTDNKMNEIVDALRAICDIEDYGFMLLAVHDTKMRIAYEGKMVQLLAEAMISDEALKESIIRALYFAQQEKKGDNK